jgi:adenosine/AMP kinase
MILASLTLEQQDLVDDAYMIGLVVANDIKKNAIPINALDMVRMEQYFEKKYPKLRKIHLYPIKVLVLASDTISGSIGVVTGYRAAVRHIYKNRKQFDEWLETLKKGELDGTNSVSVTQESACSTNQ